MNRVIAKITKDLPWDHTMESWPVEYPRELGRYWDRRIAELNAENFRKNGFTVRVVGNEK